MRLFIPEISVKVSLDKELKTRDLIKLKSSKDTANAFRTIFDPNTFHWREELFLLCLNNDLRILGFYKLSSGGMSATCADVRIIFTVALKLGSSRIAIAHNHPSGSLRPSAADIELTKRVYEAAKIIDIQLIDHIILSDDAYYSFADEGDLFN